MMMQRYCYECGGPLSLSYPEGDERPRETCRRCGWINYVNPKVQVAMVATHQDRILWMQRAEEPRKGYWSLPGGFMEVDESPREAAVREAKEETGIELDPESTELYVVGNIRSINEVHLLFRAECNSHFTNPGPEAQDAQWFTEENAPWQKLAYGIAEEGLRRFYRDMRTNDFGIYYAEIISDELYLTNYHRSLDTISSKYNL
ncbi:NUDIX hydrolase [Halioglobus maricola]|nr:NUDIX hydrolase [Halioglobus maricola]